MAVAPQKIQDWLAARQATGAGGNGPGPPVTGAAQAGADVSGVAIELVAHSLESGRFHAVATSLATRLAGRLRCTRVSIGFRSKNDTVIEALSHSAGFRGKQNLLRQIARAMDEAIDQEMTVAWPPAGNPAAHVDTMHAELARDHADTAVFTIPFCHDGCFAGAMTFERGGVAAAFDEADLGLAEQVALLAGPVLELRRRDEMPLLGRTQNAVAWLIGRYANPGNLTLKTGTALSVLLLLFLVFAQGEYRVTADATLEGMVERVVVATQDGYIDTVRARPGDRVRKGQVLATLDDRLLEDIGVSRAEAAREASKPFWQA